VIVCGLPSWSSAKSSLVRLETMFPCLSLTVASRLTAFTFRVMGAFCWLPTGASDNTKETIRTMANGVSQENGSCFGRTVLFALGLRPSISMGDLFLGLWIDGCEHEINRAKSALAPDSRRAGKKFPVFDAA